ncbi:TPA: hypothetical protein ACVT6Z_001261 [Clostridioides difficile]|uniref:hypothetical protein n=1 Tax=Clostridioides difficile TaxID=1496 RepID=UPI001C1B5BC3|nr:hypothetical protein [Clostridioides difficile]HBG5738981.1 hypothetical protein [Clostridioides difficile]
MAWVDIDKIINKEFKLSEDEMELIPNFDKHEKKEGSIIRLEKTCKTNKKTARCTRYPGLFKI